MAVDPSAASDDVELLSYLLNPSRREHALVDLARERLRVELPALPAAVGGKKGPALAEHTPGEVAAAYGARADAARRLAPEGRLVCVKWLSSTLSP